MGLIFIGTIILFASVRTKSKFPLTIIGSVLGVGIGLGLQDIAKNSLLVVWCFCLRGPYK